jgi:cytochrome P450
MSASWIEWPLTLKALREYEPRVTAYTDQLLSHFSKSEGKPVNVTDWFNFYSFDVMGDLAWGKSFGMLQHGEKHYFMKSLHADMKNIGLFSHLLWLFPIVKALPILNYEHKRFWKWVHAQVNERKQVRRPLPSNALVIANL